MLSGGQTTAERRQLGKKRRSVYRCVGIAGYPDTGPERVWGKWDLGVIVSQTVTWR